MTDARIIGFTLALVASLSCATPNKYTPPDGGANDGVQGSTDAQVGSADAGASSGDAPLSSDGVGSDGMPSQPDTTSFDGTGMDRVPLTPDVTLSSDGIGIDAVLAPSDNLPPTILSVVPGPGATGVRSDAKIVVTFSEPMDRTNTESAFASSDIPSRTFSWDGSGTILTVTPTGGLQYAEGSSVSVTARSYAYSVATSARDLAGNRLQQAMSASFTTLRRITMSTPGASQALSGTVAAGEPPVFADGYAWVSCNNTERAFLTFDLTSLPNGIDSFESATANWAFLPNLGPPAAKIEISHLAFTSPSTQLYDAAATTIGNLSAPQGRTTTFSGSQLREAIEKDYQTRAGADRRTQYRMRLLACSGTDGGSFSLEESTIAMTFLIK